MNSRELVKAAIAHRETPRVPYCIQLTRDMRDKLRTKLGVDDVGAFMRDDVALVTPPWWRWYELGEDWRGAQTPHTPGTVAGTGSYRDFADTVARLRNESGRYVLVAIYGSHFEKANFARGIENFLADIAADYAFAKRLCTTIVDKNMVMLENILALDGIDGVLLGSDWGAQRGLLFSPDTWDDLIRPGEQREYDLVHSYGRDVWVHSCGSIEPLIPRLVEMGVDVLNPVQPECMDISKLKADAGDRLTFWGGISTQTVLPFGTPDEVRAEARRVRSIMAEDGGYIFSPSQELQGDVPVDNLMALLDVAREGRAALVG